MNREKAERFKAHLDEAHAYVARALIAVQEPPVNQDEELRIRRAIAHLMASIEELRQDAVYREYPDLAPKTDKT